MSVSLEPVSQIARFGNAHFEYGDNAILKALSGRVISHNERKELASLLREQGVKTVKWERKESGHDAGFKI